MNLLAISDLIARLHPLMVHLPIGILLVGCIIQLLAHKKRFSSLQPAVPFIIFLGMIFAVLSCITGYLLSQTGDYSEDLVTRHQWFGISLALTSIILFLIYRRKGSNYRLILAVTITLVLLIFITGHLGGSLTHGSTYLTDALFQDEQQKEAIPPIADVPEAILYADVIQPLLAARCVTCHGPDKKKGKLRLDAPEFIMAGGEDGKAVVAGHHDEGELPRRILLPIENEDHMPPKEKIQLTSNEIELLKWWITNGANFHKKIKDIPQDAKIKPVLTALASGNSDDTESLTILPANPVPHADSSVLAKLKFAGVNPVPITTNSNYLSLSVISAVQPIDTIIHLLSGIKNQLLILNLGNSSLNDQHMSVIASLKNVRRLYLNNTLVTDKGIALLNNNDQLTYLNLVGTNVDGTGLEELKPLKNLKYVFLYKTKIDGKEWVKLKQLMPEISFDSGGYVVPTLATDTIEVKLPE